MTDDGDDGTRVGLWVAVGVVTLLLFGLIGGLVFRQAHKATNAATTAAAPATKVTAPASSMALGVAAAAAAAAATAPGVTPAAKINAAVTTAATATTPEQLIELPISGALMGKLYFEVGSANLPTDPAAKLALDTAKSELGKSATSSTLVLSGFHDASGDAVKNAELAKQRAKAVRDALTASGVDITRVGLRKPEVTTGGGPANEARRVEIRLVP
jgi:outer membrane protein OmpA-like peptidoglycan-associated protein